MNSSVTSQLLSLPHNISTVDRSIATGALSIPDTGTASPAPHTFIGTAGLEHIRFRGITEPRHRMTVILVAKSPPNACRHYHSRADPHNRLTVEIFSSRTEAVGLTHI
jgi:hypothetical protein